MTQALSVRCQHCGAPLQISDTLRFITCGYCHTELQIVRDASTIHTEILSQIEAKTDALDVRLGVIEIQNEIERLDREWEAWRQKNFDRDTNGTLITPPSPKDSAAVFRGGLVIGAILEIVALLFVFGSPGKSLITGFVPLLFGPVVFGAVLWIGKVQNAWARTHASSLAYYQNQRTLLLQRLSSVRIVEGR